MLHGGRAQGSGGKRSSSRGAARLLETYLAPDSGLLEGLASARFTAGIGVGPPLKRHARAAAAEMSKLVRAAMEAQGGEGGSARPLAYGRLFYLLEVEELLPSDILSIAKVVTVGLHRTGAELASCSPWQVDRPFLARVVPAVASLAWRLLDALKDRANLARIYSSFDLYACLTLLGQLHGLNEEMGREALGSAAFHCTSLDDALVKMDLFRAKMVTQTAARRTCAAVDGQACPLSSLARGSTAQRHHLWSLVDFPFLFSMAQKRLLLFVESSVGMRIEAQDAFFRAMFEGTQKTYLPLHVRRDHIVADTMALLKGLPVHHLRRQLRISFADEPGIDHGGLCKEFFYLILTRLFSRENGGATAPLFLPSPADEGSYWFAPAPCDLATEVLDEYRLVGLLMGLAIYNSVLIPVSFNSAIFAKLLAAPLHPAAATAAPEKRAALLLDILAVLDGALAEGLAHLLRATREQFDRTYGEDALHFAIDVDAHAGRRLIELKDGGAAMAVTWESRCEYVSAYCETILNRLVARQFDAFREGFERVLSGSLLMRFAPRDVEALVCGVPSLDMDAWRAGARYEGYEGDAAPLISWFWSIVVEDFTDEQRGSLLFFVTGTRRAPVVGLSKVPLTIMKNGRHEERSSREACDVVDARLPTAHTCFNYLMLPEYSSRLVLRERLLLAISNCEGFGLE